MQFGVCCGPETAAVAAGAGFDYFETTVAALLKPREGREAFEEALSAAREAPIPCPAVNCFVPRDLKITGPDADAGALSEYARTVFERAGAAGVGMVVFGSGGARRVPEGCDSTEANRQLVDFCRAIAGPAADNGVTVAIEPLNRKECNVLTSVGECADLVREVDRPAVQLLADGYHMLRDGDPWASIVENAALLVHVHVATRENRRPPGAEPCDLAPFFAALVEGGYSGRVSIEGRIDDAAAELPAALKLMRTLVSRPEQSP